MMSRLLSLFTLTLFIKNAHSGFAPSPPLLAHSHGHFLTGILQAETDVASGTASGDLSQTPREFRRIDYLPPDFVMDEVSLNFELDPEKTIVTCRLQIHRNPNVALTSLVLDGEDLKLLQLSVLDVVISYVDNFACSTSPRECALETPLLPVYVHPFNVLVIPAYLLPKDETEVFSVETVVEINPSKNLQLEGLYKAGGALVTHLEPEGFRRITFAIDRPDVLATYRVRLAGKRTLYPVLLSNGIEIAYAPLTNGRHMAVFVDTRPKPSYLFALVAGKLNTIADTFLTQDSREVSVQVHSEGSTDSLKWALWSVMQAMKWDELRFGRIYDSSVFHVVCVDNFNAGAMENSGLNIFNCNLLQAQRHTTTDAEYKNILRVIGHEYFHHWTGNHVTVRDWFQLTVKEGLTVFRDQLFMGDMTATPSKRVEDAEHMRLVQFREDAGALSHPIRPETYKSMTNFYTTTVYKKGAEVVRMLQTLLGKETFRDGMNLYFNRHDLEGVTCEDFLKAHEDASNTDLKQFGLWYSQAGTPEVHVVEELWDESSSVYFLKLRQHTEPTEQQSIKHPLVIPINVGLIGAASNRDLLLPRTQTLVLTRELQSFIFPGVTERPLLSILRGFSAPVRIVHSDNCENVMTLALADTDPYGQWAAAQILGISHIRSRIHSYAQDYKDTNTCKLAPGRSRFLMYVEVLRNVLLNKRMDINMRALILSLPALSALVQEVPQAPVDIVELARRHVKTALGDVLRTELQSVYVECTYIGSGEEPLTESEWGRRELRNVILSYLTSTFDEEAAAFAFSHFINAQTMSDKIAALKVLVNTTSILKQSALDIAYIEARGNDLALQKWFAVQAGACPPEACDVVHLSVRRLLQHKSFKNTNANFLRSLVGTFASNAIAFHAIDGSGYSLLADEIIRVDKFNKKSAAALSKTFANILSLDKERTKKALSELYRIRSNAPSDTLDEVITKAINALEFGGQSPIKDIAESADVLQDVNTLEEADDAEVVSFS